LRSLRVASNCTFSYVALRASYVCILQQNKWFFTVKPYTLLLNVFCLTVCQIGFYLYSFIHEPLSHLHNSMYILWMMRCTFEHPYLLSTAHSPPFYSFSGKNSLLPFTPSFRFKMLLCLMNSTLVSPNTRIEEPIILATNFFAERHSQ